MLICLLLLHLCKYDYQQAAEGKTVASDCRAELAEKTAL
jgi:hypothetical protein